MRVRQVIPVVSPEKDEQKEERLKLSLFNILNLVIQ